MSRTQAVAGAVVVLLLLASPAAAGPEEVANDIAAKVMSPFCPGVTLHDCPSAAALALRDRIERWVRQGQSEDQILERLEAQYGVGIRSTPPAGDGGWLAWALPGTALLVGLVLGWLLLKRWTSRPAREGAREGAFGRAELGEAPTGREELGERDRRRLEQELAMLRSDR
jgi:formate-dependent nitrite reductase complex subunit NrfG